MEEVIKINSKQSPTLTAAQMLEQLQKPDGQAQLWGFLFINLIIFLLFLLLLCPRVASQNVAQNTKFTILIILNFLGDNLVHLYIALISTKSNVISILLRHS